MALMAWNSNLSVNVQQFDTEHKKLIDLVNQLHDAMKGGRGKDAIGGVLKSLVDYTQRHFAAEEALMKMQGYPDFEAHKKEHNTLVLQVLDFKKAFEAGKAVLSQELLNFLRDWVASHIQSVDRKYGPYFNTKGIH